MPISLWAARLALGQETPAAPAPEPPAPTEPAPAPEPASTAALEAAAAEARARAEVLAAQLEEQQAAIRDLQDQLTEVKLATLPPDTVTVAFEGHYRARGAWFEHLYLAQGEGEAYRAARKIEHRLWLRPRFEYRDAAKLWVELRGLQDVAWGDNASLASTALFAGEPSSTGRDGLEVPTVQLGRVWTEFSVPVGIVRVGRMPSEWGMGLLVAPGDGFDQPFGEASYPTTNDRILFATRPIAVLDGILGREDRGVPLFVAVAFDRLVEDPLFQYHGFECSPGVLEGDPAFDVRCDSDGDGVTDLDHGYQDDGVDASSRPLDWWVDSDDDVTQMVYVLAYRGEGVTYLGQPGDLTAGLWAVNRTQRETDSKVWILDGAFEAHSHRVHLQAEVVAIDGTTRALVLPDASQPDPLKKKANLLGYAAKGGYLHGALDAQLETGFASGDDDVADAEFTGRALHPDHNVGLLLYEQVLAQVTASQRTTSARGLWSNGGVVASRYVNPVVSVEVRPDTHVVGGFVAAWPNRPDGAVIRCKSTDAVPCTTPAALQPEADALGWELDLALKHTWQQHLLFSLEAGYARVTDRLPLEAAGLDPDGAYLTVQSRVAWQF